ncbi:pyridoxal-phosphate dependent enzyme, partial [Escherichia coli]|nr:pyridoxal-phosphate dependent enzyme [Escherichia coli]
AQLQEKHGYAFVHPLDDPEVIAGPGTIALEILRQHPQTLHAFFCSIGGGGLISGIAAYVKAVRPDVKVIGVQSVDSDAMARSVAAGKRVELKEVGLFADGTAVKLVGKETFRITRELVDEIITFDSDAICAALK